MNHKQTTEAARKLMAIVKSGRQWSIATAGECLPPGWELRGAEDSHFHPCTVKNFAETYRAYARHVSRT
jgi:uncharacterized protein YbdZ (MbtH family)